MSTIPCLTWVKRGVTNKHPHKIKLTQDEISELVKNAGSGEESDNSVNEADPKQSQAIKHVKQGGSIDDRYDLSGYDSDDAEDDGDDCSDDDASLKKIRKKGANKALAFSKVAGNFKEHDEYLSKDDDESDEEAEIQDDDNILTIGKISGDMFNLEAYVYNEGTGSLYCHHDVMLGSFPLAMEWIGYDPGEESPGNLLAVGTMVPDIELWDLDVCNTLEPAFVLHGATKKKGKKKMKMSQKGHTDAVLALSWNSLQQNALASGSADFKIGLWDIDDGEMVMSIDHHAEKVQSLQWHPFERQTLLSGSCDQTVKVFDCRDSDATHKTWNVSGEVEKVRWNPHEPFYCLVCTDNGHVYSLDVRTDKPVFTLKAHESAISGLALSSELPGCLLTSSLDKFVKVWDIRNDKPQLVDSRNFKLGGIHCMEPCPDSGFVYALGGETELRMFHLKTSLKILNRWDLEDVGGVAAAMAPQSDQSADDDDDDEDDSDEDEAEFREFVQEPKVLKPKNVKHVKKKSRSGHKTGKSKVKSEVPSKSDVKLETSPGVANTQIKKKKKSKKDKIKKSRSPARDGTEIKKREEK